MKRLDRFRNVLNNHGIKIVKMGKSSLKGANTPEETALLAAGLIGADLVAEGWEMTVRDGAVYVTFGSSEHRVEFVQTNGGAYRLGNSRRLTEQDLQNAKTPNGGWNRSTLEKWGVPWPPPKGWKAALLSGRVVGTSEGDVKGLLTRLCLHLNNQGLGHAVTSEVVEFFGGKFPTQEEIDFSKSNTRSWYLVGGRRVSVGPVTPNTDDIRIILPCLLEQIVNVCHDYEVMYKKITEWMSIADGKSDSDHKEDGHNLVAEAVIHLDLLTEDLVFERRNGTFGWWERAG